MAKGDKVTSVFYATRSDGVNLYRFAVPNTKHINDKGEEVWDKPQFMIKQDQTGVEYAEAIDVEGAPYTYTETDKPIEGETTDIITQQKAKAFDYLTGGDNYE